METNLDIPAELRPLQWDMEAMERILGMLQASLQQEVVGTEAAERLRWMVTNGWRSRLSGHVEDVDAVYCAHLAASDDDEALALSGRLIELHGRLALEALRVEQAPPLAVPERAEACADALQEALQLTRAELIPWLAAKLDAETLRALAVRWDGRRTRSGRGSPRESRAIRGEDADLTRSR